MEKISRNISGHPSGVNNNNNISSRPDYVTHFNALISSTNET